MTDAGIAPENLEATEAWNGPLFDICKDFQAVVVSNARALWGDRAAEMRPKVRAALTEGMADMARDGAVYADSSTWAMRAVAPGD